MRSFFRILAILCLGILLLLALVIFGVTTPPGETAIRHQLEGLLSSQLKQPVYIRDFTTDLFSSIAFGGIDILPPDADVRQPVLRINRIAVRYDLSGLLHRKLTVRSVIIDSVSLIVHRMHPRHFNIPLLDSLMRATAESTKVPIDTEKSPGVWNLILGHAALRRLDVHYIDDVEDVQAGLYALSAVASGGGNGGYRFDVDLPEGTLTGKGLRPESLSVHVTGALSGTMLHLDRLNAQAADLRIEANGQAPLDSISPADLRINAAGNPTRLLHFAKRFLPAKTIPPVNISGDVRLAVSASGSRSRPIVAARLEVPRMKYRDVQLNGGIVRASFGHGRLLVDTMIFFPSGGTVAGNAAISMGTRRTIAGTIVLTRLQLRPLTAFMENRQRVIGGVLDGSVTMRGDLKRLSTFIGDAHLRIRQPVYGKQHFPDIKLTARLKRGEGDMQLRTGLAMASAHAAFNNDAGRIRGTFTAAVDSVGKIVRLFDTSAASGNMRINGSFSGRLRSPDVNVRLNGRALSYRNFPLDSIEGSFHYTRRKLVIDTLEFSGALNHIDANHPLFGIDSLAGGFRYRGALSGPIDAPVGTVTAAVFNHPAYKRMAIDSAAIALRLPGRQRMNIDELAIYKDTLAIHAGGAFNFADSTGNMLIQLLSHHGKQPVRDSGGSVTVDFAVQPRLRTATVTAHGRALDVAALDRWITDSATIRGALNFDAHFSGSALHPDFTLALSSDSLRYRSVVIDSARIGEIRLQNHDLEIRDFVVGMGPNTLTAEARVQLVRDSLDRLTVDSTSRTSGRIRVPAFQLKVLEPFLREQTAVQGRMTLDLNWNGLLADPHLRGGLTAESLSYQSSPAAKPVRLDQLRTALADTLVRIDTASGGMDGIRFSFAGTVGSADWQRYRANIEGSFSDTAGYSGRIVARGILSRQHLDFAADIDRMNLQIFQPIASGLDSLGGTLALHTRLTGSLDEPAINGSLNVHDLVLKPSSLDQPFTGGTVAATFSGSSVRLDSLFLRLGSGFIFAHGALEHRAGKIGNLDFRALAQNLPLQRTDQFVARVDSANISCSRQEAGVYALAGDIYMGSVLVTANFEPKSILPWTKRVRQPATNYPQILLQTRLNIRLHGGDSLWVDNNLAHLQIHAALGVIGVLSQPNLNGRVTIDTGGTIQYLDRKFSVSQGTFDFADPNKLNPNIAFAASSTVTTYEQNTPTDYQITLSLKGSLDQLQTSLTSTPPLDQPDIAALLTLGATREQLTGNGAAPGIVAERAAALTTGQVAGFAAQRLGKTLGLDQVTVRGNLLRLGEQGGPQLVATKTLSQRTRITYSTTMGQISTQTFQVEYRLSPFFSLEGMTDDRAEASVSLKYTLRFP